MGAPIEMNGCAALVPVDEAEAAPAADAGGMDGFIRALGRVLFFEGLALFPVDYADMPAGFVSFRFTPLDSCIVAKRAPAGEKPQRCGPD